MKRNQGVRRPHRIKRKKSIFRSRVFWLVVLILIISGAGFYFFLFSEFFQIKKIIVVGEEKISKQDIEAIIENKLEKKILFFGTKSIFLVDSKEINISLLKKFPQIDNLNLKRSFPNVLKVKIEERKPVAVFCLAPHQNFVGEQKDNCFLTDKEGIIFKNIGIESPQMLKIENRILLDKEWKLGERVIDKEILALIFKIESVLKESLKISLTEAILVSEQRLNIKTSEGWQIYLALKEDIDWQLTKLGLVLEKEIPLEKRKDLEYIDLRFGNLAPYKYR